MTKAEKKLAELNRRLDVYGNCARIAFDNGSAYAPLLQNWIASYRRTQARINAIAA